MSADLHRSPDSPGSRWQLAGTLRDWMGQQGYGWCDDRGVLAPTAEESLRMRILLNAASILDAHFADLERRMLETGQPMRQWVVFREGDGGDAEPWCDDYCLMTIYAYTFAHAMYVFLLDFTQPMDEDFLRAHPFPSDYCVSIVDALETLATDAETGAWDLVDVVSRLATLDTEGYRLIPAYRLTLNEELLECSERSLRVGERR